MTKQGVVLFLAVCLWSPIPVWAQVETADSSKDLNVELPQITVEGRQLEEKLSTELAEYGHKVQIITGDALKESGYVTVLEALTDLVPGLYVRSTSRAHNRLTMRLQGSSQFLILLDGVRLNNRLMSGSTTGNISIDDAVGVHMVERIEVLSGGEALFYGTDATAGVINIVTKKPTEETSGQINVKYGSHDSKDIGVILSGSLGKNKFLAHARLEDYDGYQLFDTAVYNSNGSTGVRAPRGLAYGMKRDNFGLKYSREFGSEGDKILEASFIRNTKKSNTPSPASPLYYYEGTEYINYAKWSHDVTKNYSYFLKFYHHHWWTKWTSQTKAQVANGTYGNVKDLYGFQDWGIHLLNSYRFNQGSELLFGMEYQNYWGKDAVMELPALPRQEVTAGYFSFRPHLPFWPEWKTSFGMRYNYMHSEQNSINWNASSRMPFFDDTVYLAANTGTTFRLPTAYELYQDPDASHGGYIAGNPDLKPQKSFYATVSLGGKWQYGGLEATGFYEETNNRIRTVAGTGPLGGSMYQNISGDTLTRGFTLSGNVKPGKGLTISGSYTRQTEKNNGAAVERQTWPKEYGNISVAWDGRIMDWDTGVRMSNNYTGKQYFRGNQGGEHKYGDYWTTNLSWYVKPTKSTTVSLKINNLFDVKEAYSMARLLPAAGSELASKVESDGYYYYDQRMSPLTASLSLTYQF